MTAPTTKLLRFPPHHRRILHLLACGWHVAEIATLMGVTRARIETHVSKIRHRCRLALDDGPRAKPRSSTFTADVVDWVTRTQGTPLSAASGYAKERGLSRQGARHRYNRAQQHGLIERDPQQARWWRRTQKEIRR